MANISGFYIPLVLALIVLITKATSVLCSWQLWVLTQSLFLLMCRVPAGADPGFSFTYVQTNLNENTGCGRQIWLWQLV